jgi:hypothetical protein
MPCTGNHNQKWWQRMLSVWIYVAIGSISYISFERPSELAANYNIMREVEQWALLEAKLKVLQEQKLLTEEDAARLLAKKQVPEDQTNNWNASEWSTRAGQEWHDCRMLFTSWLCTALCVYGPHKAAHPLASL